MANTIWPSERTGYALISILYGALVFRYEVFYLSIFMCNTDDRRIEVHSLRALTEHQSQERVFAHRSSDGHEQAVRQWLTGCTTRPRINTNAPPMTYTSPQSCSRWMWRPARPSGSRGFSIPGSTRRCRRGERFESIGSAFVNTGVFSRAVYAETVHP